MFDKRLMAMRPESKKHIVGKIICQWTAHMIYFLFFVKTIRSKTVADGE